MDAHQPTDRALGMATCVVGAGPAGLLFCLVAGIRRDQLDAHDRWMITVVDKRDAYERTHRLRMDRRPYLAAQAALAHPLFDELITSLEAVDFRPAANELEALLLGLVRRVGIDKHRLTVGSERGEMDVAGIRRWLESDGALDRGTPLTVIGADSVSSATRDLVAGAAPSTERVHQTVVRLRLEGEDLPATLKPIRQLKIAKILGSALDYRSNPNGFSEVDLFLSPDEHHAIVELGARPAAPVALTPAVVATLDAPLFVSVVQHIESSLASTPCAVSVQSTFRLEHRYCEQVSFSAAEVPASVFLVGDAAVSLPFFRGMACLMKCVWELAEVHTDAVATGLRPEDLADAVTRYDTAVAKIRSVEVKTVESRARGIRLARELVRVSAMSPFPIQTWLLSVRARPQRAGVVTPRLGLTAIIATLAAVVAVASPFIGAIGLSSIVLQGLAGALYRSDMESPAGSNPWMSVFCRFQMAALIASGAVIAIANPYGSGAFIRLGAAVGWFVLGVSFIGGMYATEALQRTRSRRRTSSTPASR